MPNATLRADARTLSKSNSASERSPRARRPLADDPVARLSFVAPRDGKTLPKPEAGQFGRCFWHVKSTGDTEKDNRIGDALALEYLAFEEAHRESYILLPQIVCDMPRKLTGIEVSFLTIVGYAARAGAQGGRDVVAYWARCREERERKPKRA